MNADARERRLRFIVSGRQSMALAGVGELYRLSSLR